MPGEFDIIRTFFSRDIDDASLRVGIGDDGAVIRPAAGHDIVVVTDTLVAGRHFPGDASAADIGWRALAVNLSDCAAMAATPRHAFLNLSLPEADETWLQGFADGFFELADRENVLLAGGDTTRGPLTITVTVLAEVPAGKAIKRSGAQAGDRVLVTGWPGRARTALGLWRNGQAIPVDLQQPWRRPEPRTKAVSALRLHAHAAIDVSDGLAADLAHVLDASGCGATLDADTLPVHPAVDAVVGEDSIDHVLNGGDDYELCITCAADAADALMQALRAEGIDVTDIGECEAGPGLRLATSDGGLWELPVEGFDHFGDD